MLTLLQKNCFVRYGEEIYFLDNNGVAKKYNIPETIDNKNVNEDLDEYNNDFIGSSNISNSPPIYYPN